MQLVNRRFRIAVHCQVACVVVEIFSMVGQVDNSTDGLLVVHLPDDLVQYIVGVTDTIVVAVDQYFLV